MSSSANNVCYCVEGNCYIYYDINPFHIGLNEPLPANIPYYIFEAMMVIEGHN